MAAFRPDIQALRAIAVLLVVAFHVWPTHVHGGYVGVDVFFVISGYLITGHLVREVAATGRVDLPAFYARRARRLLPAASLTLVAVAVASYAWMPAWTWATTAADIAASTGYAENWMLVRRAVDYQAQNEAPSPLQHFWSLAVEEQFYFGWPLLVAGVAAVWTRWGCGSRGDDSIVTTKGGAAAAFTALQPLGGPSLSSPPLALEVAAAAAAPPPPHRAWYALPMAAACAASFASALFYARARPEASYFTTHTRLYELGLGGLLAVMMAASPENGSGLTSTTRLQTWLHTAAALAGLAAIGTSAALFTARTLFPGAAALVPTLGAAALLWAGDGPHQPEGGDAAASTPAHALVPAMSHPWLQYTGDISYSLYLVHWPVVVVYPFATGRVVEGVLADGVLVCVISFALAHACKRCWEDRFRETSGGGGGSVPKQPMTTAAPAGVGDGAGGTGLARPDGGRSTTRRCCRRPRLSPNIGALAMTALMVTATLTASVALHALSPSAVEQDGGASASDVPTPMHKLAGPAARSPPAAATVDEPALPPSPECDDFFGVNATRPYPGADAPWHRCIVLNTLSIRELAALSTAKHAHGRVAGTLFYYPDVLSSVGRVGPPPPTKPARHVVILGDSHGKRWHPAFDIVGRRLGLNVTNLAKNGCPPALIQAKMQDPAHAECQAWNAATVDKVLAMRPSAVVMVAQKSKVPLHEPVNATDIAAGIARLAHAFVSADIPALYIKSTPVMGARTKDCLAQEAARDPGATDLSACAVARDKGVSSGIMEAAAAAYPMMRRLSFDDIFCPGELCPPAIGNVVVYDDAHHVTGPFSRSLANALQQRLLAKAPHLAG